MDIAAGHHVSFPDDDYPCCELVTSFIRVRNLDRYRKYDTARSFFMIMCNPQLNQHIHRMKIIFRHIYAVKKKERDKFSMCTSRIYVFFQAYTPTQVNICPLFFFPSSSSFQTDNRLCWVKYVYEIKRLTKESYYPQTKYIVLCSRQFFFCSKTK